MTVAKLGTISTDRAETTPRIHSITESTTKIGNERGIDEQFRPYDPPNPCLHRVNQSLIDYRGITGYSPGRAAALATKNDQVIATFLDYRALLQAGAVEDTPYGIDIPAVLEAIKGDRTLGPQSRKALWEEPDQVERDRLKAAGKGVAA